MSPRESTRVPVANSTAPAVQDEVETWRTIPNLITALRILLIFPFSYYAASGQDLKAVVVFFIAGVTDSLDGTLARWLKQTSRMGRLVDPVADKFLAGVAYVVLSVFRGAKPAIPLWIMGMVVARDVLILLGCWIVYRATHDLSFKPSLAGKLNTLFELLLIGWFLTAGIFPAVAGALPFLYVATAASIMVSFTGYARQGVRMLQLRK